MSETIIITGWHEIIRSQKQHYFKNGKSLCGEYHDTDGLFVSTYDNFPPPTEAGFTAIAAGDAWGLAIKAGPRCYSCQKQLAKQNGSPETTGVNEMKVRSLQLGGVGPKIILNTANALRLIAVADSALAVAKSAKCRITEGATPTATGGDALVPKDKLNQLKRKLRKLSPRCLGKE